MILLMVLSSAFPINIEVVAGLCYPGASNSNTPAVYWAPGVSVPVSEGFLLTASAPFWNLDNYYSEDGLPDYVDLPGYVEYDWHYKYSERSAGFQAGARYDAGPVMFQIDAGFLSRTLKLGMDGVGKGPYLHWEKARDTSFMASAGVLVPAGGITLLSAGVRTFDSGGEVSFTTGVVLSFPVGEGE